MDKIRVLLICHGNICRSPMAEFILKDILERNGLAREFEVASAATSTEEIWGGVGNPVYPPARDELRRNGIGRTEYTDYAGKRARQVLKSDYAKYDLLLCADSNNVRNTLRIVCGDAEQKVHLLMEYAGYSGSVADPWYTGDFAGVYRQLRDGCYGLLKRLGYGNLE